MLTNGDGPKLSVVIPTYNRREMLRKGLEQLTRQRLPVHEFEVVVSDDGSSDGTMDLVASFADRLRLRYHFQEDLGFRASAARNAGARLATAPILVFLDSGAMVGPDFLRHHLEAHAQGRSGRAVAGYAFAYSPETRMPDPLREALDRMAPEEAVARYAGTEGFQDVRHPALTSLDFDLNRSLLPWMLFWSMNCSIKRDDFWAVGGFAEDFHGWGLEDMEFGFRVQRHGLPFHFSREAWVVHAPHERDRPAEVQQLMVNIDRFAAKHPEPVIEIGWGVVTNYRLFTWEAEYRYLLDWREECHDLDVSDEVDQVVRRIPRGERIAVIGVGGRAPASLPPSVVLDFDRELLDRAVAAGHAGHHSIGLRTPLADGAVDHVVLTSRLAGPRKRWNDEILAEARRIGRTVHVS